MSWRRIADAAAAARLSRSVTTPVVVAVGVASAAALFTAGPPARAAVDEPTLPVADGSGERAGVPPEGHALLTRARDATAAPHSGRVSVVSFTATGPRVSELVVQVRDGEVELRRPARLLVDPIGLVDTGAGAIGQRAPTSPLGFDVDAIVARWQVTVGSGVELDTGPATPVHLVRTTGSAIGETIFVDDRTGIAVRRETRAPDGRVLRVVAYLSLEPAAAGPRPAPSTTTDGDPRTGAATALAEAGAAGFEVPAALDGGFVLVTFDVSDGHGVARYTDGLSVVSIYQLHGELDSASLEGAVVHHVAGRDVWTWPGREPSRFVWTGDGVTWTAVSEAPVPVIEGTLSSLPGDLVGHDASHRLRHGLRRVWDFVTTPLR